MSTYGYPYPGSSRGRIDQGVDFAAPGPARAIASGTVLSAGPAGFVGGTGDAVVITMDQPWTTPDGKRTYDQIYYAEQTPLVHPPSGVLVGDHVMAAGGSEIGFARNGHVACALVGGLGAGSQPTVCGNDFYAFLGQILGQPAGAPTEPGQHPARPSRTAGGAPPGDLGVVGGDPSKQPPFPFTASAFANLTRALGVDLPYDLGRVRRARYAMVKVVR